MTLHFAVHGEGRGAVPGGPHNAEAEAARLEWLQYEAVLSSARDMRTMEGRVAQRAADRLTSLANELALGSRAAEMAVQVNEMPITFPLAPELQKQLSREALGYARAMAVQFCCQCATLWLQSCRMAVEVSSRS